MASEGKAFMLAGGTGEFHMKSSATRDICTIAGCIAIAILASARADAKVFRWNAPR